MRLAGLVPVSAQETVPILKEEDKASFYKRIKVMERKFYANVLKRVMNQPEKGS